MKNDEMISKKAQIAEGVEIGFNVFIGPKVKIGKNTKIFHNVVIDGKTEIGENCKIYSGAIIGSDPQDLKYTGEDTSVKIGNNCIIREYVTVNKATAHEVKKDNISEKVNGTTIIGDNCLLMAYVHVAHDCVVQNNVILANVVTLAGHVTIEEHAIVGGIVPVHQFEKIGKYSIIGGDTRVSQDVPPFCKVAGNPMKLYGLNTVGLTRNNFSKETITELKNIYKILFRSKMNHTQALEHLKSVEIKSDEGKHFLEFIRTSERGICRE